MYFVHLSKSSLAPERLEQMRGSCVIKLETAGKQRTIWRLGGGELEVSG